MRLGLQAIAQKPVKVQFDDLSIQVSPTGAPWNDPIYRPLLLDPSAEEPPTVLNDAVKRVVPDEVEAMADAVANPQVFDKTALSQDYAGFEYQTFWGSFGWVTIYLPAIFYIVLGLLSLAALAGLVVRVIGHGWSRWASLGTVALISLAATILISFAKQMSLLAYTGLPADPQGRYLFVLSIPIAWLLLVGLGELWAVGSGQWAVAEDGRKTKDERRRTTNEVFALHTTHYALLWLWAIAITFFAAYCLLALIMPFYYS
jgi:hypothetical protein